MIKTSTTLLMFLLLGFAFLNAQTPELSSWVINTTGATGYNSIPSNVQQVNYTSTDVYVSCTCIPGYSIGPWNGNPNTAKNQNFVFKITRSPQKNSGTGTTVGLGHIGVWTNGVSIFNVEDAMSYNNQNVWFRNAYFFEGGGFDNCLGHPQQQGEYHHHVSPTCLYNDKDSTHHSPVIGYAFDGFPVYGAYAYTNSNGTGAIKRMTPSYRTRSITDRTVLPNGTAATYPGPAINSTYPLGAFIQDFEYIAGSGDLDAHNGRFCVTPEYPAGTYAYFVTIDAAQKPVFPYTFYGTYYGVVQTGNTGPASGHNTIPGNATKYTSLLPEVSISAASGTTICEGESITFNAVVSNGGSAPAYSWFKNNTTVGVTSSSYTSSNLKDKDSVRCTVVNTDAGVTPTVVSSKSIVVKVTAHVDASVKISCSPGAVICEGTSVLFTATAVNGGTTPVFTWKVNGKVAGSSAPTLSLSDVKNGDIVETQMQSNAPCVTNTTVASQQFTITVYPNPPVPTISVTGSLLNSSAASGNQWFVDNVQIPGATFQSITPVKSGKYSVLVTDANGCVSRSAQFDYVSSAVDAATETNGIVVTPNPFVAEFSIHALRDLNNVTLRLSDIGGRQLYFASSVTLSPSAAFVVKPAQNLAPGIYFLECSSGSGCIVFKLSRQ